MHTQEVGGHAHFAVLTHTLTHTHAHLLTHTQTHARTHTHTYAHTARTLLQPLDKTAPKLTILNGTHELPMPSTNGSRHLYLVRWLAWEPHSATPLGHLVHTSFLSPSRSLSLSFCFSNCFPLSFSRSVSFSFSLSLAHSLSHTHTHSLSLSLSLSFSLSLSLLCYIL